MTLFSQLFNSYDRRSFAAVKSDKNFCFEKKFAGLRPAQIRTHLLIEYLWLVFFFSSTPRKRRQHENSAHKNARMPRSSDSTIPPATLRSGFQPGDTSKAQFSSRSFLLVRDDAPYILVEGQYRRFQRQLGANRDFGPLDVRVFRGVFPPSLCSPHRHPRDPLISGLRGSRNEPSEARWHEEGSMGWTVGGTVQNYAIATSQRSHPSSLNPPRRPVCQQPPSL